MIRKKGAVINLSWIFDILLDFIWPFITHFHFSPKKQEEKQEGK